MQVGVHLNMPLCHCGGLKCHTLTRGPSWGGPSNRLEHHGAIMRRNKVTSHCNITREKAMPKHSLTCHKEGQLDQDKVAARTHGIDSIALKYRWRQQRSLSHTLPQLKGLLWWRGPHRSYKVNTSLHNVINGKLIQELAADWLWSIGKGPVACCCLGMREKAICKGYCR